MSRTFCTWPGSYPKDRQKIIAQAEAALQEGLRHPDWFNMVPDYEEEFLLIVEYFKRYADNKSERADSGNLFCRCWLS